MIFAVIGVMGALGCIVYLQLYGLALNLFPEASWMAFGVIAAIDFLTLMFLLICIGCGKFG